ncbi:Rho GTPase-activating protein 40, partial [Ophiophagus hannah]
MSDDIAHDFIYPHKPLCLIKVPIIDGIVYITVQLNEKNKDVEEPYLFWKLLTVSLLTHTRNCPCKMNHFSQKSSSEIPQLEYRPSQTDSSNNLAMDTFWLEVESIKESTETESDGGSLSEAKLLEEGEAEAEWLQDAGLSDLMKDHEENSNIVLLSTLTKTQAAAVQRRLDTYTRSRRKKNKPPIRDVRDVFGVVESEETEPVMEAEIDRPHRRSASSKNLQKYPVGIPDFQSPLRDSVREELFSTEVAYSEQAAILLKGSFPRETRRIKEESCLSKFKIPKGRLGVTRTEDLSLQDMKKIPTLALIELTALCDIVGLELKRNKAVKRKSSVWTGILISFPSLSKSYSVCKCLEQKLENEFYSGFFRWDEVHQNDVSGLLKRFIRELPTPLLTAEYLPAFAAVQNIPDLKQRLQALNLLILILPEPNRNTLKALLEFLRLVVTKERKNKMSLWNVSTVIAPNLFMHKSLPSKIPEGKEKQLAEGAADIVRMMIHYQALLWTVPSFLVTQIRKLNENSSWKYQFYDRKIKNLLRKIHVDKEKTEKNNVEPCKIVKIQASLFLKDSLEVHLTHGTKVADVLRQFQKNLGQNGWSIVSTVNIIKCNGSVDSMNFLLYEVGGNINEHCLDPDTYLLDLYHVNPHAEWIIRQTPSFPRTP